MHKRSAVAVASVADGFQLPANHFRMAVCQRSITRAHGLVVGLRMVNLQVSERLIPRRAMWDGPISLVVGAPHRLDHLDALSAD